MSSITTTAGTLVALMTLIDNNSDQLKEGEYLSICNLMRDLHRASTQVSPPRNLTQEFDRVAIPTDMGDRHRDNIITNMTRLNTLRRSPPRICNRHRVIVLRNLDEDIVNGIHYEGRTMTQWIHALEAAYHEHHPNTPINFLQDKYREFRNEINQTEINNTRLLIGQCRALLRAVEEAREVEQANGWTPGSIVFPTEPVVSLSHPMVPP